MKYVEQSIAIHRIQLMAKYITLVSVSFMEND